MLSAPKGATAVAVAPFASSIGWVLDGRGRCARLPPRSGSAGSEIQLPPILGDKVVNEILAVLRDELVDPGGVVLLTFRREGESGTQQCRPLRSGLEVAARSASSRS